MELELWGKQTQFLWQMTSPFSDVNRHLFDFNPGNKKDQILKKKKGRCYATIKVLAYLP